VAQDKDETPSPPKKPGRNRWKLNTYEDVRRNIARIARAVEGRGKAEKDWLDPKRAGVILYAFSLLLKAVKERDENDMAKRLEELEKAFVEQKAERDREKARREKAK
jgi:hypothetical protein